MPYVRRNDLSLYYESEGSGAPPLVFVHGWCCDHTFYKPQFEYFRSAHAVTTFDLRGCGSSDQPDYGYDIPSLADDLAWLCEELGISKPVLIGHSLGGMIVIELAARYPSVPSAVVADDPGPINPLPETRKIYESFAMELEGPDGEGVRRTWVEDGVGPTANAGAKNVDRRDDVLSAAEGGNSGDQRRGRVERSCCVGVVHRTGASAGLGTRRKQRARTPASAQSWPSVRPDCWLGPLSSTRGA